MMLRKLYSQESAEEDVSNALSTPKDHLRAKLNKKQDIELSYCSIMLGNCLQSLCCCFVACCRLNGSGRCRRHIDNYSKFQIAQKRLMKEKDI